MSGDGKNQSGFVYIWLVLASLIAIWRIYNYFQGTGSLDSIGVPVSVIVVLLATILFKDRSPVLYYILIILGFALAIASLISIFLI